LHWCAELLQGPCHPSFAPLLPVPMRSLERRLALTTFSPFSGSSFPGAAAHRLFSRDIFRQLDRSKRTSHFPFSFLLPNGPSPYRAYYYRVPPKKQRRFFCSIFFPAQISSPPTSPAIFFFQPTPESPFHPGLFFPLSIRLLLDGTHRLFLSTHFFFPLILLAGPLRNFDHCTALASASYFFFFFFPGANYIKAPPPAPRRGA